MMKFVRKSLLLKKEKSHDETKDPAKEGCRCSPLFTDLCARSQACWEILAATATKDTIVAIAAEQQDDDNKDIVASTSVISAEDTVVAVSAEAKQQDDPDNTASASIIVAFASTSTTTICCS